MEATNATHKGQGLFRTPLSCALLTGALTVAINEFFRLAVWPGIPVHYQIVFLFQTFLATAMKLHGPVHLNPNKTNVIKNLVMPLTLVLVFYLTFYQLPWHWLAPNIRRQIVIKYTVVEVVCASLLGIFLAQLYGAKNVNGLCSFLVIVAAVPSLIFSFRLGGLSEFGTHVSTDVQALGRILRYLSTIAEVALPTIPIERALRAEQQHRENLAVAPLTTTNENAPRDVGRV